MPNLLHRVPARDRIIGLGAILANVVLWGAAPAVIKHGLDTVSPSVFLYYRFLIVTALATPFLYFFRSHFRSVRTPKDLLTLLTIGFLTNPLSLGILFYGLHYTTSASAAILAGISPIFIIVASAIFLKEKITRFEIAGIVLATAGTLLIVFETPTQAEASNPFLGNAIILTYNVVWTIGVLLMKKLAHKHHPFVFGYTGWFIGALVFAGIVAATEPYFFTRPLMLTQYPDALSAILYMAIGGSLIAFTAYQVAQKYLDASQVSIFTYLQPLVAIPLSVLWLQEQVGIGFSIGAIALMLGVLLAELHPSSSRVHSIARGHTHHHFGQHMGLSNTVKASSHTSSHTRLQTRKRRPVGRLKRKS